MRKERRRRFMAKIKVYIKNNQNEVKIPVGIRLLIRRCCNAVLVNENFNGNAEVSVSFVDNKEIKNLNKLYRDKDQPTDVLSFPLGENGEYDVNNETGAFLLGDIVISLETAVKQAAMFGHSLEREIGFLTVHSMLHLLGYDHEKSALDAAIMREREEAILEKLGLSRASSFIQENED
jgi:probable rRNA maturation factor